MSSFPAAGGPPRIDSLLVKPVSALCNLNCAYCFYLDRDADPYRPRPARTMSDEMLERLVDTFLFYSYPNAVFAFQGGEPTLAGLPFFEKLVALQQRRGRNGHNIGNSLQTNGILIDDDWCRFFREYNWLVGISIDGPEEVHNRYRVNKAGRGSWEQAARAIELMKRHGVDFNVLCVVSQANAGQPRELYRYFRTLGVEHIQYIPLAEFDGEGNPMPFTIDAAGYGAFLTGTFDAWWPDRRKVRIRLFDNLAEAAGGFRPGACTMRETCDSYCVVEYNGDVYPCDFFVEGGWKLGNIEVDSWAEIARRRARFEFASKKAVAHPACDACEYRGICRNGCPKLRHGPRGRFEDLDWFCGAYKALYARALEPLRKDLRRLYAGRERAQALKLP